MFDRDIYQVKEECHMQEGQLLLFLSLVMNKFLSLILVHSKLLNGLKYMIIFGSGIDNDQ